MLGPDGRADAHAFVKTDSSAVTCPDARTDARTDDGDARAHASTVRKSDARTLLATNNRSALLKTHTVSLLVGPLLERQDYGSYRLR